MQVVDVILDHLELPARKGARLKLRRRVLERLHQRTKAVENGPVVGEDLLLRLSLEPLRLGGTEPVQRHVDRPGHGLRILSGQLHPSAQPAEQRALGRQPGEHAGQHARPALAGVHVGAQHLGLALHVSRSGGLQDPKQMLAVSLAEHHGAGLHRRLDHFTANRLRVGAVGHHPDRTIGSNLHSLAVVLGDGRVVLDLQPLELTSNILGDPNGVTGLAGVELGLLLYGRRSRCGNCNRCRLHFLHHCRLSPRDTPQQRPASLAVVQRDPERVLDRRRELVDQLRPPWIAVELGQKLVGQSLSVLKLGLARRDGVLRQLLALLFGERVTLGERGYGSATFRCHQPLVRHLLADDLIELLVRCDTRLEHPDLAFGRYVGLQVWAGVSD